MEGKEVFWDLNERFGKRGRFEALLLVDLERRKETEKECFIKTKS